MASEFDASCENDPNFAVICAFLEKFGKQCGLPSIDFLELQQMLENSDEVPTNLSELIIKLLRRVKKTVKPDKWEKSLIAVTHTFSSVDAWEIERFGYKKAKLTSKVRVLKELLEMQFDYHVKFKNEINKLNATELRSQPLGRDKSGHAYWFHSDDNYQIRIYKEDLDDETWKLIAKDRESLVLLISKLSDGDIKFSSDSAVNEDSSSLSEKPLIDTGQPENDKEEKTTISNGSVQRKEESDQITKEESDQVAKEVSDQVAKKESDQVAKKESDQVAKKESERGKEAEQKENVKEQKEHERDELPKTEETKTQDPPIRPILRIKKLSELMDSGAKRQKLDDYQETTDSKGDVIDGETISEPVMVIKGDGTGEDNQSANERWEWNYEPSPIIGEEIEEDTFHVYGEGCGADCLTGNEGKATSSSGEDTNSTVEGANSSSNCVDDSIKSTMSELKDNKEKLNEVPSNKLDDTITNKTDNLDSATKENLKSCDDLDSKSDSTDLSKTEEFPDGSKSPVPKKTMFFFGSPLKNTSFSPSAKIEFGQVSPNSKETPDCKLNSDNNNEELNESEKDINGGKSKHKDSNETNDTNFEKENSKNSEENTLENEKIDSDQSKEDNIQTIISPETTSEECNEISNDPVEIQEVKETLCIKKVAYQCGKEEKTVLTELTEDKGKEEMEKTKVTQEIPSLIANENDPKSSEATSDLKTTESRMDESNSSVKEKDLKKTDIENNDKDKSDETLAKAVNEDSKCVAEKSSQIYHASDETVQSKSATENDADAIITSEESSDAKSASKEITKAKSPCEAKAITDESCKNKPATEESTKSKPLQEDSSKVKSSQGEGTKCTPVPENVNKINKTPALNIAKAAKTIKDDQLHKSLRYFRTRRVANVRMPNEIKIPIKSFDPVLEAARRMTTVPVSVPPKPIIEPPKKISTEVVYVPDRKAKTKKEREITPAASQKNNKKPKLISDGGDKDGSSKKDDKTNSSRSSPLSVADSVITLPDSLENSCAEAPEKDPLADSDADNKSKAMNLGSLSFDYNDSSTPPPIPSFLTRRTLRKRGRDPSPEPVKPVVNDSKKMKMKGKRQINTSLRKSIEEKKEQQVSSSDEVTIVPEIKPTKKAPKKKSKAKSRKKQSKKKAAKPTPKNEAPVVSDGGGGGGGGDDDDEVDDGNGEDQKETSAANSKQAANNKKDNSAVDVSDDESSIDRTPKTKPKTGKNTRILAGLEITDEDLQPIGVRQSRRLAQIKIKEQAEPAKKPEPKVESKSKKKPEVVSKKEATIERRKRTKADEQVIIQVPEIQEKKKKRKKDKNFSKHFDESKIWQSSSESSEADEDVEEEEEVIEEYEPPLEFKSDHEFSPESDIGSDSEYQPLKRARTARKTQELDQEEEDFLCQKCGKSDHPEWILLCDKCDNGWHCSCLRPPLLNIPEGDWHCPPCQHILLVENLQKKLEEYDKQLNKKVLEDRRKERLAYVGISLNNVLPSRENEHRKKKRRHSLEESDESFSEKSRYSDATESESDSDEPIYQLRQRRQAKSYKFNEYDELIKSAIQDEMEEVQHTKSSQSRGKDIATIVRAEEEERKEQASAETKPEGETKHQPDVEHVPKKEYSDDDEPVRPVKKRGGRKKGRKMTNLDISSEDDDERDEDFKGSNSSSEEEDDFEEEDSDDGSDYVSGKRRKSLRPVRRSTRVRVSRYDRDFINDDDEDEYPRKKKKRQVFSETESSDTDGSWKKKKKKVRSGHIKKRKGRKKDNILDELSDLEIKRKPKIKYGGLTSSEEETGRRRTRGKKTTYVDTLGSDSEEERKKRNPHRYIDSDDENDEDFVANEEDDEKESEGAPEDEPPDKDEEEDEDDDDDEPQEERRPLMIPKIYIKKPPVSKEILPSHANTGNKEPVKPVEKRIEEKEKQEENKVEPVITHEKEVVIDKKSNGINEIPKIESANNKPVETVPEPLRKREVNPVSIEMVKKFTNEPVKPAEEVSVKVEPPTNEYFPLIRSNEITVRPVIKPTITVPVVKPVELIPIPSVRPVELTAMEIEQEKKRKAFEEAKKMLGPSNSIEIVPVKRGRKPEEPPVKISTHEPIVSNVDALIHNDESNDELSEPPSVTLPMFEELANKNGSTGIRRKIGKGRPKKTLEEAVANLGGYKKESPIKVKSESELCIEIAAPPQPFSQASPVPSVITRMLQTSPGQTTAFPVGKIRPKQFATMPADDDDEPLPPRRGGSPQTGPHFPSPHIGQFLPGGPRGPMGQPYGQIHPTMSPYPRGILSPHQVRNPRPPMPSHMYPPHRMMDPMPSGGGPLNMSEPSQQLPPSTNASNMKVDPQNYSRPPTRYPPISTPPAQSRTSPRPPLNVMSQMHQTRPANISQQYPPPSHQPPVSSGPPLSSGPPVSSGMPLPSGPPVSVGMPLPSGPPVSIGMSLSSGPPRVSSGMALPSGPPPVSSGMPLPSGPPVSSGVPLPSGPPVSSGMSLPSGPPVSSGIPLPARPPPQQNYYGGYPHSEPMANEDAMPPSAYQGSPFQEEYSGEGPQEASENSNSKSYGGEGEETGEFGGLVSYFSSQREDDLDS